MSAPLTRIDAVAEDLCRISTAMPPELAPGGFTFINF